MKKQQIKNKVKYLIHLAIMLIVLGLFVLSPIYVMAIAGESYYEVGSINYSTYSAGTAYESFWVGISSSPPIPPTPITPTTATSLAQSLFPIIAVAGIAIYILKGLDKADNFSDYMGLLLAVVIGSALLVALAQYLSSL